MQLYGGLRHDRNHASPRVQGYSPRRGGRCRIPLRCLALLIGVATAAVLCGCQSPQSSAAPRSPGNVAPAQPGMPGNLGPNTFQPASPPVPHGVARGGSEDWAAVETLVAQVDQAERLNPMSRQKLFDDLQRADPAYRGAMLQTFLADLAYRRQMDPRDVAATPEPMHSDASAGQSPAENPLRSAARIDWPQAPGDRRSGTPPNVSGPGRQVSFEDGDRGRQDAAAPAGVNDARGSVPSPVRNTLANPPPRDDRTTNSPIDIPIRDSRSPSVAAGSPDREASLARPPASTPSQGDPAWLRERSAGDTQPSASDSAKPPARNDSAALAGMASVATAVSPRVTSVSPATPVAVAPSATRVAVAPSATRVAVAPSAATVGTPVAGAVPSAAGAGSSAAGAGPLAAGAGPLAAGAASASGSWQDHLAAAIKAMEAESQISGRSDTDQELEARLRLLYLAAQRRDDALRKIPSAQPWAQEFWSNELYGLSVWLDAKRVTDPSQRAAEARLHLTEAIQRLNEVAPLTLRNLTFSHDVKLYGSYEPFQSFEFAPSQKVILYAEVDNFKSDYVPNKGYFTSFQGRYSICDSAGQEVASQKIKEIKEHCRVLRRDFFLVCQLSMLQRINPGKYTLKLTIEDNLAKKMAQESISFTIRDAAP